MNKDHSFEHIDFTKLLLWLCLLLLLVFGIWAAFIIPSNNSAHAVAAELAGVRTQIAEQKDLAAELQRRLDQLEATHADRLHALAADFDEKAFVNFCETFFEEAILEDNLLPEVGDYTNYKLLVSAKISSPSSFYDFLSSLNSYANIMQVDFPIIIKRTNDVIKAQFNIKVFKLKEKSDTLH